MPRSTPFIALALLISAVGGGCAGGRSGLADISPAAGGGDSSLGETLAGESCRSAPRAGEPGVPAQFAPLDITCGTAHEPVGTLWVTALAASASSSDAAERHAAIERAAGNSTGGRRIAERMACDAGTWTGGSLDVRLSTCMLRGQGWPEIVLLAGVGGALYQAEGLPSLLPVLENMIAQKSGTALTSDDRATSKQILESKLGRFYNSTQNFAGAENAFRRALDVETHALGPDAEGTGTMLIELALQVSNQGRFDEAAALFRRADPIVQRSTSDALHARYSSYLALDAANQRKYSEALGYAQEATAVRRKRVESQGDSLSTVTADPGQFSARGELAHSLRIEAAMALRLGDTSRALAAVSEALEIMSATPGLPLSWRPEALALMAEVDAADGRSSAADRDLSAAVALSKKLFGATAPTALVLLKRARLETNLRRDQDALRDFREAFGIIANDETARAELVPGEITPFLTAASAVASEEPNQRPALADEMFRAGQFVGSSVADQTIGRAAARLSTSDPAIADLIRQSQAAERARDAARLELANEQAKPDIERGSLKENALDQQVQQQTAAAAALQQKLIAAFPAYASLAEPGPVGLNDLQKRLSTDEGFLSFVIGHTETYAMLLRRDGFTVHRIEATDAALAERVAALREALAPRLGALPDYDIEGAHALYADLLGAFDSQLSGVTHLIVAPTGALASLPFSLLVTAQPEASARHAY